MDLLIQGALVLLGGPGYRAERRDLYLSGGRVAGIGAPPPGFTAERTLDGARKLAMPGLVNSHTHLYTTLFRNYADDLSFEQWLFERLMPREDEMTDEDAYWCSLLACAEMIATGTTAFMDMHMHRFQCLNAAGQAGLRAVLSRGLVGEGPEDEGYIRRLADTMAEREQAKAGGRLSCMLGPHAIYTCGRPLLRHVAALAAEKGMRVHIHLAETQREFDACAAQNGCTPVEYAAGLGLFDGPAVAAHCVVLTEGDIALLKEKGVYVATCPLSNMKLGNGFAPVPALLEAGVRLCLGTDGAASNNTLNLFREMAALCTVHKGAAKNPLAVPAGAALYMATAGGAAALGLEGAGAIAVGSKADVILLDMDRPQMHPVNDPVAGLVYSANGSEVDTVLVDGEILMEKGELKTVDTERVYYEVEKIRARLL